jgi:hypothetical protein
MIAAHTQQITHNGLFLPGKLLRPLLLLGL